LSDSSVVSECGGVLKAIEEFYGWLLGYGEGIRANAAVKERIQVDAERAVGYVGVRMPTTGRADTRSSGRILRCTGRGADTDRQTLTIHLDRL
jgi:hypothetical protein